MRQKDKKWWIINIDTYCRIFIGCQNWFYIHIVTTM